MNGDKRRNEWGLWNMRVGQREESLKALELAIFAQGGSPYNEFDRIRKNRGQSIEEARHSAALAWHAAFELINGGYPRYVFDGSDWQRYYAATLTRKELRRAEGYAYIRELLYQPCPFYPDKKIKDTHFAFMGITHLNGAPLTIAHWLTIHPYEDVLNIFAQRVDNDSDQPYVQETTLQPRWYLVLQEVVPGSCGKNAEEQSSLLPAEYEVPTAITQVTKNILTFRKTGYRGYADETARCVERTVKTTGMYSRPGRSPEISNLHHGGMWTSSSGTTAYEHLGIGASRIIPVE